MFFYCRDALRVLSPVRCDKMWRKTTKSVFFARLLHALQQVMCMTWGRPVVSVPIRRIGDSF